jgi:hypothetical protein
MPYTPPQSSGQSGWQTALGFGSSLLGAFGGGSGGGNNYGGATTGGNGNPYGNGYQFGPNNGSNPNGGYTDPYGGWGGVGTPIPNPSL